MGSLGAGEIILILVVFLLLFGAKRLPDFAKSLGKSLREFKKATKEISDEIEDAAGPTDIGSQTAPKKTSKKPKA
ncbi:Sec-independent protein translocase subunit TatA [bacterium]|nr:Sec-independent protein translocase subunit TatA [bacterium]MBU1633864.1 Sec-independent protein translocase subunit TatA [bacterium]MBU1872951.1 Sec-independent protein translocase subunit TatA [bacterium]